MIFLSLFLHDNNIVQLCFSFHPDDIGHDLVQGHWLNAGTHMLTIAVSKSFVKYILIITEIG